LQSKDLISFFAVGFAQFHKMDTKKVLTNIGTSFAHKIELLEHSLVHWISSYEVVIESL
jgi:hypothetical protein